MTDTVSRPPRTRALVVGLAALLVVSVVSPGAAMGQAVGPPPAEPATTTTTTITPPTSTDSTTTTAGSVTTTTSGATSTTTTTTPGGTTTTSLPQIPQGPVPANPPPPTTVPTPSITVPPAQVQSLLQGIQGELAQFEAIAAYGRDQIVAVNAATRAAASDAAVAQAQQGVAAASATHEVDVETVTSNVRSLSGLAIALYLGEGAAAENIPDSLNATNADRQAMLSIVLQGSQHKVKTSRHVVSVAAGDVRKATDSLTQAQQIQAQAHQTEDQANAALAADKAAALGQPVPTTTSFAKRRKTATTKPKPPAGSPAIQGPAVLTAAELASWFASTRHTTNITVPIPELAADYINAGQSQGVMGDVAFAQSVIETGFFGFPAGGELAGTDNNFAGIGACDTCTHGWTFPDARTGVAAQLQLLDAYASTTAVATPLIGKVSVAGCCRTWTALTGVWATNPNYGYEVLSIYQEMVAWALPRQLATAGLTATG